MPGHASFCLPSDLKGAIWTCLVDRKQWWRFKAEVVQVQQDVCPLHTLETPSHRVSVLSTSALASSVGAFQHRLVLDGSDGQFPACLPASSKRARDRIR